MTRFFQDRKKLVQLLLILAFVAVAGPYCYVNTRPTQITVMVRDSETGAFLGDTYIEVQNANGQVLVSFVTDEDGTAGVKRLDPSPDYRILARHVDYAPALRPGVSLELHKTTEVRIPLRPQPGGRLYVGMDRAYVAAIDTASNLVLAFDTGPDNMREWPVRHVAAHPDFPWIYASARYISYVLEPQKMDAIAELALGGSVLAWHMTATGDRLLALVQHRPTAQLSLIDPELGRETASVRIGEAVDPPQQMEEAYVLDRYLAWRHGSDWHLQDLRVLLAQNLPLRHFSWAALSPDLATLYCGDAEARNLYAVDTATWTVIDTTEVGPGIAAGLLSPMGDKLYLASEQLGVLLILDAKTLSLDANVPVGRSPLALAVDPKGERLYVANHDSRSISIMDMATSQVYETIDVGLRPFSIAVR